MWFRIGTIFALVSVFPWAIAVPALAEAGGGPTAPVATTIERAAGSAWDTVESLKRSIFGGGEGASAPGEDDSSPWDPLEPINRATYGLNASLWGAVIQPMTGAYRSSIPPAVQTGLDNAFTNLREPMVALASWLQGDLNNAGLSLGRFAINSTEGILGIYDVATPEGWVSRPEDFASTLCTFGIGTGPYIVLPILGPSTAREATATVATYAFGYGMRVLGGRAATAYFLADRSVAIMNRPVLPPAADPYIAQRDAYLALRRDVCSHALGPGQLKAGAFGSVTRAPGATH
jgi:phospholipid-binding lipoprotein MlaA